MKRLTLSRHTEWLSLIELTGPFLAVPVLEKAFPQGLDIIEIPKRQRLRAAYDEWCEAVENEDPLLPELHREWIRLVFTEILEYDGLTLKTNPEIIKTYSVTSPERSDAFVPDWLITSSSDSRPRLFISIQPPETDFYLVHKNDKWPASLIERMMALCRAHAVRLGVITDGELWMLVNAPVGGVSSNASWYARIWFQEPITLKAFKSLWSVRRLFGPSEETVEALLDSSMEYHEEITDTLGEQVRRAVEVLVQCLDKADADRNRDLLRDVLPAELYEAGLTVMMRLVFILCAEERGLLLSGDPVYDESYAVSTLRAQLAEDADCHGSEVLDRRHDAWARVLSVFRAVYGGIEHESLRMPPLGGSLFDPDRFPFLEGRLKGTNWHDSDAIPLPIDNRTVLLLLNSLQLLEQHGGALLLSYRSLDVEQIGHVYEGLLEYTVVRVPSVTIGLIGSKKAKNPNLALSELELARMDGEDALVALVKETTERSESAIRNALSCEVEDAIFGLLHAVCGGDTTLAERIRPFANLVRTDAWGDPIVYRDGAFMVTIGSDRRETGTHYTPKSLTESIVETTLEPVVYVGPSEGKPRDGWKLKTPAELLDLKICDPAMGSGAFLVQACRWLAERLVEAWVAEEAMGRFVNDDGEVLLLAGESDPLPTDTDYRLQTARRLIAERCLYGVDINPLAVELAKLSIWLVTLAKGRPFGFLDHNLRCGDSLLGIHRLDQLTLFKMNPDDSPCQLSIFGKKVAGTVIEAEEIRKRLRSIPIRDMRDIDTMAHLNAEIRKKLGSMELVADAMIGEVLRANGKMRAIESALDFLEVQVDAFLKGDVETRETIAKKACEALSIGLSEGMPPRKPFHWPLEYPEIFASNNGGFDVILCNPPFGAINYSKKSMSDQYTILIEYWNNFYLYHSKRLNFMMLFLERILFNLLNKTKQSCIGLILDFNFFEKIYELLRLNINDRYEFKHIVFNLKSFSNVNSGQLILILGDKKNPSNDSEVVVSQGNLNIDHFSVKQSNLFKKSVEKINYYNLKYLDKYSHLENNTLFEPLENFVECTYGVELGGKSITHPLFIFNERAGDADYIPIIDLNQFENFCDVKYRFYLKYDIDLQNKINKKYSKLNVALRNRSIWGNPRIILRQSSKSLCATIDYNESVTLLNAFHIYKRTPDTVDLLYILGLLTSDIINDYCSYSGINKIEKGKFPQIRIESLKKIPIRIISRGTPEEIIYKMIIEDTAKILNIKKNIVRSSNELKDVEGLKNALNFNVEELYSRK